MAAAMMVNGVLAPINSTALKVTAGASSVYQFTADYAFHKGGQRLDFRSGDIYALDATLKTALVAATAPMTQL